MPTFYDISVTRFARRAQFTEPHLCADVSDDDVWERCTATNPPIENSRHQAPISPIRSSLADPTLTDYPTFESSNPMMTWQASPTNSKLFTQLEENTPDLYCPPPLEDRDLHHVLPERQAKVLTDNKDANKQAPYRNQNATNAFKVNDVIQLASGEEVQKMLGHFWQSGMSAVCGGKHEGIIKRIFSGKLAFVQFS
eukprot:gene9849-3101_t